MLGKGAFGRVNLAMHKITEHLVAVKSMNKQFLTQEGTAGTSNNVLLDGKNDELLNEEKKKLL
jgi:serine/threonine protein kinase